MNRIFSIYILLTIVLILNLVLDVEKGISLRGYWGDRVLFWVWLVYTVYLILKYYDYKEIKIYGWSLIALLGLSMLPMFIPFLAIVVTGLGLDRTYGNDFNDNLRLQESAKSLVGGPRVELIRKHGFYEAQLGEISSNNFVDELLKLEDIKGLKIVEEQDSTLLVEFYFPNGHKIYQLNKK